MSIVAHGAFIPDCTEFSQGGSSPHFGWDEVNHYPGNEHSPHSIIRNTVWTILEGVQGHYENHIHVESGYRCPNGNANITPPGATNSRHMYGDAVDMWDNDGPWTEASWIELRDHAMAPVNEGGGGATYYEPYSYSHTHVHADNR